jgi:hypothetical protein
VKNGSVPRYSSLSTREVSTFVYDLSREVSTFVYDYRQTAVVESTLISSGIVVSKCSFASLVEGLRSTDSRREQAQARPTARPPEVRCSSYVAMSNTLLELNSSVNYRYGYCGKITMGIMIDRTRSLQPAASLPLTITNHSPFPYGYTWSHQFTSRGYATRMMNDDA